MAADFRYSAIPLGPPKPPTLIFPFGRRGSIVRPASEVVTSSPGRMAKASASARASLVPPRISNRLEGGTAGNFPTTIDDKDFDIGFSAEEAERLFLRSPRDQIAQGKTARPRYSQNLARRVGRSRGRDCRRWRSQLIHRRGKLLAIDFAAARMEIH